MVTCPTCEEAARAGRCMYCARHPGCPLSLVERLDLPRRMREEGRR